MKVIVTGGAGFIGSHTVDLLIEEGHEVVVIDYKSPQSYHNEKAFYYLKDILDREAISSIFQIFQPEAVIHLAAQVDVQQSLNNPAKDIDINLKGTIHILEECRKYRSKIIFASSAAVYGIPNKLPIHEQHTTNPLSIYGLSKLSAERYIQLYHELYEIPYTILRYANVYGPRQESTGEGGVVSIFVDQLVNGYIPTIYGDGTQTRDFVYVKDVARANVLALYHDVNSIMNVCSSSETTINELYKQIACLLNKEITPEHKEGKIGDISRSMLDSSLILKYFSWSRKTDLISGLKETIQFFQIKLLLHKE